MNRLRRTLQYMQTKLTSRLRWINDRASAKKHLFHQHSLHVDLHTPSEDSRLGQGTTAPLPLLLRMQALAKQLQLPKLRQMTTGTMTGENLSKRGRGIHYEESRIYQTGDDIRHIDWRVTARTGKTHTKVFREEHERPMVFLIDLNANMHFGTRGCYKSVLAAKIAAMLAFAATHDGNPVGGVILHDRLQRLAIHGKERGVLPLLHGLSQACDKAATHNIDLATGLQTVQTMLRAGTLLVMISDFFNLNEKAESLIQQIAYRHPIWLLQTLDNIEANLPAASEYGISNGSEFSWLNTRDPVHRENYLRYFSDKQQVLHELCRRFGFYKTSIFTHQPLMSQLANLTRELRQL